MKTGWKDIKYCTCNNYAARSLKGVIDTRCRNCGGLKKPIKFK